MLPEAQLDRFMFKIELGYPTFDEERKLLRTYNRPPAEVQTVLDPDEIRQLAAAARDVHVDEEIMDYIVRLVTWTREHPKVLIGGSPRASLALMNGAKVRAFLRGRDFATPDDVRFLAPYILEHRVLLTPEAELEGSTSAHVVTQALSTISWSESGSA
jgi:MoxR-like ATPase